MRRVLTFLALVLITVSAFAQVPQKMSYQAVIRNNSNVLVSETPVGMRISILQGSVTGAAVYIETQTPTTNSNGLVTIEIGNGKVVSGVFESIDWSAGTYFIKTETDPTGSTNYTIVGTSQLLSVPYALHAKTAETISGGITETDPIFTLSPLYGITSANINNWNTIFGWGNHSKAGYLTNFKESDPMFELHVASGITSTLIGDWNNAYYWGNHANAGYLTSFTETDPMFESHVASGITTSLIANWNLAYNWGNHANAGYLTSYTETDPIFGAHVASSITSTLIGNWNLAYNWGNHTGLYRPISWVPTWADVAGKPTFATVATSGSYNDLSNKPVVEFQTLSIKNDTLYLTNGGFVKLPQMLLPPTATVESASDIQSFSASLNGLANGKGLSAVVVFEWGLTSSYGNTITANQSPVTGNSDAAVSSNNLTLQSATTYHYRVKASNAVNMTNSSDITFTTATSAPQLTTSVISSITGISASSGGNITHDGGVAVTARGICWNTIQNPTLSNSFTNNGTNSGTFTSNITELALGTTYYVRAYATNSVGTTYGNEISFTTVALPTLSTTNYFDIKGDSAKAGGSITNNGGSAVISQGLCWSISTNPTIINSKNTSFTSVIAGLTNNTIYYVRAYATNNAGTSYGNEISFNSGRIIGSSYAGGLIFYNDGNGHGFVCAETNQSIATDWGCEGSVIGGTALTINSGASNTNIIVAGCSTAGIAARLCYDMELNTYSDWYLPSHDELLLAYTNLHTQSLGGFANLYYWSSSEDDSGDSWYVGFDDGKTDDDSKDHAGYVRAIRNF